MNIKSIQSLALAATLLTGCATFTAAAERSPREAAISSKLITAIENADYDAFVADGEAPFKQLTKAQFAAVSATLGPRLKAGYTVSYLGELKQMGYHVTL